MRYGFNMTDKKWYDQKNQLPMRVTNRDKIKTIDYLIEHHPQYKNMLLNIRKTYEE